MLIFRLLKYIIMVCNKCKIKEPIAYEEIGLGKYCQDCLQEEQDIWEKEAGFQGGSFNRS
jgi:hypothetical protein